MTIELIYFAQFAVELRHAWARKALNRAHRLHENGAELLAGSGRNTDARSEDSSGRVLHTRRRKTGLGAAAASVHQRWTIFRCLRPLPLFLHV